METLFNVFGLKNPVHAVLLYFEKNGIDAVDKESFESLAKIVGDVDLEDGFVVKDIFDLQRLCTIGKFQVWWENGKIIARTIPKKITEIKIEFDIRGYNINLIFDNGGQIMPYKTFKSEAEAIAFVDGFDSGRKFAKLSLWTLENIVTKHTSYIP